MSRLWIKLWGDMLADPKVARLPDWQWRKFVECLLLAGINDDNGKLQPVDDIAWMLHLAPARVEEALQSLSRVGVVRRETDGSWYVTNFNKRQDSPSKERTRKWRERERHSDGHGDTHDSTSTSTSTSSSDSCINDLTKVIKDYENEVGPLTKRIMDALTAAVDEYSADWIIQAIGEAARNNKRSWSYVEAILKRWKVDGFQSRRNGNGITALQPEDMQRQLDKSAPVFRAPENGVA